MKHITILTPCYNEVGNVEPLVEAIQQAMGDVEGVTYSHLFIDNASTDGTQEKLRELAGDDVNIQVILNNRNFGNQRSSWHALLQAEGDAVILMASDFQNPPELIPVFVQHWIKGAPLVFGIKEHSDEQLFLRWIRASYYRIIKRWSDVDMIEHFDNFALVDRKVIEEFKKLPDVYPYVRGIFVELGFTYQPVSYRQPKRKEGSSTNNFYSLYDLAMLGITSYSKIPLRIATFTGFIVSILSLGLGMFYFLYKLLFWDSFDTGVAPLIIGLTFFSAIQLFFIGIIGEYIASIHTQVLTRPHVVEKERINID